MNTIPAQEIKRSGITAVDELIGKGEVHAARVMASLENLRAGRVQRGTAEELLKELDMED